MPAPDSMEPSSLSVRLSALLIVVAAVAAYHNTFSLPFVFDDQLVVIDNPTIRDLRHLGNVLATSRDGSGAAGRPLLNLSFALNYAWGGLAVQGYHIGNLLLHTASALLLFGLVRRTLELPLMRSRFGASAGPIGLGVAAIWVVHPLNTESVTCIAQRTELLVAFFYLLTLYCIVRSAVQGATVVTSDTGDNMAVGTTAATRWQVLAVASCLLGMASKEVMVTMPLVALLFDRAFLAGTFRDAWRQRKGLHLALLSTWLLMGVLVVAMGGSRGDAAGFGLGVSAWSYALKQCEAILLYLKLAVWPHPLVLDYGTDVVQAMQEVLPQGLALLALLGLTAWALVRRPALGFIGAWFFIILGPSSSFVPLVAQTMAEHRMYLPLISVVVLGVVGAHAAFGSWLRRIWWAPVVALALTTVQRNEDYRSELGLWHDTAVKRPNNPRAHLCLGMTLMKEGRNDEAVAAFLRVLLLDRTHSTAHNALGQLFAARGWHEDALEHYEIALRGKSDYAAIHSNMCDALRVLHRLPEAIQHGEEAVRLNPRLPVAQGNLGLALDNAGRVAEAIPHYEEAVRLNPNYALARNNLGVALLNTGRLDEARSQLEAAVRIAPDFAAAHNSLGAVFDHLGQKDAAIAEFETALRLQPDFADAQRNLASLKRAAAR